MQALHASYHPDSNVPIAWWLLAYGTIQLALSQIHTMHQLRHLNAAAVLMTATWTIMVAVECVQTGGHSTASICRGDALRHEQAITANEASSCAPDVAIARGAVTWHTPNKATTLLAGRALRRAGTPVSHSLSGGSKLTTALSVFEAPSVWSFAIANVLLPEVPPSQMVSRKRCALHIDIGHMHCHP